MDIVRRRDPAQPEFQQAVEEVVDSVLPVLDRQPELRAAGILERIIEPERVIQFRVPWVDDEGEVHVSRGFRVEFNSAIGPYKGGLRFHPSVNLSILKFLGFEQIFKNALTTLPVGGGKVVTLSDSSGFIVDEEGIDRDKLELVMNLKNVRRGRICEYVERYPRASYHETDPTSDHNPLWEIPCDVALPCATQNEINHVDAHNLSKNGCRIVAEGANMPSTPEAVDVMRETGVRLGPAKAASAGGVAVSALEMSQNAMRLAWGRDEVEGRLREIMKRIHASCAGRAREYGFGDDLVRGANIAGFLKVARAMIDQGVV